METQTESKICCLILFNYVLYFMRTKICSISHQSTSKEQQSKIHYFIIISYTLHTLMSLTFYSKSILIIPYNLYPLLHLI